MWCLMNFISIIIKKISQHSNDPLFKNSYFIMSSSYINTVLGFLFWIIIAHYYSPANVGLATTIFSAASLVMSLSGLGLNYGFIGYLSKEKQIKYDKFALTLCMLLTFTIALIFIIGMDIWAPSLSVIKENNLIFFIS